jgi:hypothetical protein
LDQARKIKQHFQYHFDPRLAPRRLLVGTGCDNNDRRRRRKFFGIKFFKGFPTIGSRFSPARVSRALRNFCAAAV